MKPLILAIAMAAVGLAGCGEGEAERASAQGSAPATASDGAASGGATRTGPAGERIEQPLAPPETAQSGADVKPDPGDANDHSNPRHDAKTRQNGD